MFGFSIVWVGQFLSLFGSAMTQFALIIWAWKLTGSATALALVAFFSFGPTVALSPIAGALVDRWSRKLVMMLSDLAAGLATIAILVLYATGRLQIWHLYAAGAFAGAFHAFQWPAYSAAISMMLPKSQYARASGMVSLAESGSHVMAPLAAGVLIGIIGIAGILIIDIVTFVAAIGALLIVHVPSPPRTEAGARGRGGLWQESLYGFRYILERPSLLGLQLVFLVGNLLSTVGMILLAPMVLARTGNNPAALGSVQSAGAMGGVVGALALSVWGGPKRRVHGVLVGHILAGLLGHTLMGLGRGLPAWIAAAFLGWMIIPIVNGSNQAIWMAKVAPDVQGRVFSVRRLIAQISAPLAMLAAGPLADRLFEPGMMAGGRLAPLFGPLVGTGQGSGMALMMVGAGVLVAAAALSAYAFPVVRDVEALMPDHDAGGAPEAS